MSLELPRSFYSLVGVNSRPSFHSIAGPPPRPSPTDRHKLLMSELPGRAFRNFQIYRKIAKVVEKVPLDPSPSSP